jgi:formate dehydrogenase subunit gamma
LSADDKILRFRAAERHLHWAIAIPFKICYLPALVLVVVYNPHPNRPLRELVSWIHRLSGACLAILPAAAIAWHWREWRVHLENVRTAWSWSLDDVKWLALMAPAALTSRVVLPDQDKFNAAEKINFMSLTLTYPAYVVTGITIWFFGPPYISWLIHFGLALAATPLVAGHIFMATVNPGTRVGLQGMITGWVDRHWASHHYALWYREQFGRAAVATPRPVEPVVILPARMREAQAAAPVTPPVAPPKPGITPQRAAGSKADAAGTPVPASASAVGRTEVFAAS